MEENEKNKTENNFENNANQQNGNSEVKPKNKKLTIALVSVIIVLLIVIGVCVGLWFAGDTTKIINNKEEVIKEENSKTEENKIEEEKQQQSNSKKIDETKPWIYDANYSEGKSAKILKNSEGKEYNSVDELILPFVNVNSEYGNSINEELKKMYENSYNNFGGASEEYKITSGFFSAYRYEYAISDNILSVVIYEYFGVINGGITSKYHIYNINLNTLEKATLEDVYKDCGFESEKELNEKVNITIANEADKGNLFNDTVWDKKTYYMDKNMNFNIVVDGPVTRCNVVIRKGVVREENTNSSQNSTNEDNKNNTNVGSISNIFSTDLKDIEGASIAKLGVSFDDSSATLSTDINNDGKSDILRVEQIIDNEGMYRDGCKLFLNEELFFNTDDNTIQGAFRHLSKIYVVDLDSTDSYYDLVLWGDFASADYGYIIFKYNGTTLEPIIDSSNSCIFKLMGNSMYVDNKGILVPQDGVFENTNPILSDIYYSYRENKVYEVPMGNYTNELIEFKNVYFTTDLKNIDNYMESTSIENDKDNGEILISEGIYVYRNVKAYIVEDNIDNYVSDCMIKVKLEDGRLGYIFVADGVLAG